MQSPSSGFFGGLRRFYVSTNTAQIDRVLGTYRHRVCWDRRIHATAIATPHSVSRNKDHGNTSASSKAVSTEHLMDFQTIADSGQLVG